MVKLSKETLEELDGYFQSVMAKQVSKYKLLRLIAFKWIPLIENNILAFVYGGASFLVLVLGLRGLNIASTGLVIGALITECILILVLAITMWLKPEEIHNMFNELRLYKEGRNDIDKVDKSSSEEILKKITYEVLTLSQVTSRQFTEITDQINKNIQNIIENRTLMTKQNKS